MSSFIRYAAALLVAIDLGCSLALSWRPVFGLEPADRCLVLDFAAANVALAAGFVVVWRVEVEAQRFAARLARLKQAAVSAFKR